MSRSRLEGIRAPPFHRVVASSRPSDDLRPIKLFRSCDKLAFIGGD